MIAPTRHRACEQRANASSSPTKEPTNEETGNGCDGSGRPLLGQELSAGRAGRNRSRPVQVAGAAAGRGVQEVRLAAGVLVHGRHAELPRSGHQFGGDRCLAAEQGAGQGQARRDHDAQRAAVPGRAGRRAARRLHGGQRQSAVHAARAGAPAEGLGRGCDLHPRELRDHAAAGGRQGADQADRRVRDGRSARLRQGAAGQLRGAQRQEDGAGVQPAQRAQVPRTRTSPSCSTRAAPPA